MVKTYDSAILKDFIDLESEISVHEPDFSLVLSKELSEIDPDKKWSLDQFIEAACSESWQKDEINEIDHIALKHLFFRIIVPKDHWKDCSYEKFISLTKQKYREINEE